MNRADEVTGRLHPKWYVFEIDGTVDPGQILKMREEIFKRKVWVVGQTVTVAGKQITCREVSGDVRREAHEVYITVVKDGVAKPGRFLVSEQLWDMFRKKGQE